MNFDFREQYKSYSTLDLLKITSQPELYQPEAVAIASEILETRMITQADTDVAAEFHRETETKKRVTIQDVFRSIFHGPDKWINIILVIAISQYLRLLYIDLRAMDDVLHDENYPYRRVSLYSYVDLIYLPVVIFMFYRRRQWAWIILFGAKLYTIAPTIMFYFHDYVPLFGTGNPPHFLILLPLNVAVLFLMWKQHVRNIFNITTRIGLLTALGTILILFLSALPLIISQIH